MKWHHDTLQWNVIVQPDITCVADKGGSDDCIPILLHTMNLNFN